MQFLALNKEEIQANLQTNVAVSVFKEISSTNDYAKAFSKKNILRCPHLFVSEQQTAGHGLHQRAFFSPKGTGIYMSILVPKIKIIPAKEGLITTGTVVAVINALLKFYPTVDFKIKWINDILVNHKKVGGILTEVVNGNLVICIGLNLNTAAFPKQLQFKAGDIKDKRLINRDLLIAMITNNCLRMLKNYQDGQFLPEYGKRLETLHNKVIIKLGNRSISGIAEKIDNNGSLIVKNAQNKLETISTGEVVKVASPDNLYQG